MRSRAALFAAAFALMGSSVYAASAKLEAKLSLGLGGGLVPGRWNAAALSVKNPGAALQAEWEVAFYGWRPGSHPPAPICAYSIPASLPHGVSHLNFAVLVPGGARNARTRLLVDGRTFLDTTDVLRYSGSSPITVLITTRRAALAPSLLKAQQAPVFDVLVDEPAEMPVDARAYDAVALIVLDQPGLSALPPGARQCIRQWVLTGGTLVLTAPFLRDSSGSPALSDFTTAKATELRPVPSGEAVLAALCGPTKAQPVGGELLDLRVPWTDVRAAAGWAPLLFEQPLGAGTVRGAAVDPEWLWFADKESQLEFGEFFWGRLLQGPRYEGPSETAVPWSLVPQGSRIGRIGWPLLVLLALAVVAIGPVNWALLVRWRRKEWTVFTAPAAGLAFVLVIGLAAFVVHGLRPLVVHQSVNVLSAGTPGVGTFALHGLFLPRSGPCNLVFPEPGPVIHELSGGPGAQPSGVAPAMRLTFGDEASAVGVRVPQWSMRAFSSLTTAPEAAVDGTLTVTAQDLTGHVESHLPVPLHDCHLVHRWNHTAIGEVLPDRPKALLLPLGPPSLPVDQLARLRFPKGVPAYFDDALWRRAVTGRPWELLQEVLRWPLAYQLADPVLIGWGPAMTPGPRVGASRWRREEEHLYLVRMPVAARGRAVVIPVGGALSGSPRRRTHWFAGDWSGEPTGMTAPKVRGTVFEYRLPLESRKFQHQELTVHGQLRPSTEGRPEQAARVSLYDWPKRKWVAVAEKVRGQFSVEAPDPGRFILMPAGLVRITLPPAVEGTWVDTLWVDISYRGKAVPE